MTTAADDDGINGDDTALLEAVICERTDLVKALIEAGADDLSDDDGKTALIHATVHSNLEAVNALINAGVYIGVKDKSGKTALDFARENIKFEGTDVLKRLEELSR